MSSTLFSFDSSKSSTHLFVAKREKFHFQLRKERNEQLFTNFRCKNLPSAKEFPEKSNTIYSDTLTNLCNQVVIAYEQRDAFLINSNLASLKDFLLSNNFSSELVQLNQLNINVPITEIMSNLVDTSGCPEILESALYIYIIILKNFSETDGFVSVELVANLLNILFTQQTEKLFLVFEALAASCINDYYRDFIIKGDVIVKILDILMSEVWQTDFMLLESIVSLVKSFYMITPKPSSYQMSYLLEPMMIMMLLFRRKDVVVDTVFILSRMAQGNYDSFVKACLQKPEFMAKISEFLIDEDETYVEAALDLVGALTFGEKEETYQLNEMGIIGQVMKLIETKTPLNADILRKAVVVIGNFLEGDERHVEVVLKETSFMDRLLYINEKDYETHMEAVYCWINASFAASNSQIEVMMKSGVLKKFLEVLSQNDSDGDVILGVLLGLENVCKKGKVIKEREMIKEQIEKLFTHYNENVSAAAAKFIEECSF